MSEPLPLTLILAPKGRRDRNNFPLPSGAERYAQVRCHSERSEESLLFFIGFTPGTKKRFFTTFRVTATCIDVRNDQLQERGSG